MNSSPGTFSASRDSTSRSANDRRRVTYGDNHIKAQTTAAWQFEMFVGNDIDNEATDEQLEILRADKQLWRAVLVSLLHDVTESLQNARSIRGEERVQIVADLEAELQRIRAAWARLTGEGAVASTANPNAADDDDDDDDDGEPGIVQLQVSWEPGRVVMWAAGRGTEAAPTAEVLQRLATAGAPSSGWANHGAVPLPSGVGADAVAMPVGDVLGWLVAAGADQLGDDIGYSIRWLGRVAVWAVELAARGAMIPLLRQRKRSRSAGTDAHASYSVRWTPALIDQNRLKRVSETMPNSVMALDSNTDARAITKSALTGMVDAICRGTAKRIDVPAPPPHPRTVTDVAEAYLSRLDGSAFDSPAVVGGEIVGRLEKWARSVTGTRNITLIIRLDAPDSGNAWPLVVMAQRQKGGPVSLDEALLDAGTDRRDLEDEIGRLERMLPALLRPGSNRRGQVILSQPEAWDLMATTGPLLEAAGFDVRVPALSTRKPKPSLRLFAENTTDTAVGANQLADVRWSAVFGDVELTAADIARLSREAQPLIRSGGRWVAVDRADLNAAAAALAERANQTQLSGGEMLRLALGLETSPLEGGVSISGTGWAADLLAAASNISADPVDAPKGFAGELRSYQAEALTWLGFLDSVGLGGCLALDMGLGKTPTMLAHLLAGAKGGDGPGPSLVIAPPAVVGNWAAEAARFVPDLNVVVHHGANRASEAELAAAVADADVVITTYGTAVRDMDVIETMQWDRVVLDEAQAIKNASNDTSQQLRRIKARTKLALTGTPIENGLGDLWAILDFTNPGLVGGRPQFIASLSGDGARAGKAGAEDALRALNGILVFRRTKSEPAIAAELPDRIDELDHCSMTTEQIGMYQAVLDKLVVQNSGTEGEEPRKGQILAAITALKQICNHPSAYDHDDRPLAGRSGKLARLEEIVDAVFAADEKVLVFTHFAEWGVRLAGYLTERMQTPIECYHGGLSRLARDQMIEDFQAREGGGALVLSLKAGGTGLNLTAASHVVLYDRWWNPAVEDQARDRAWRIGQNRTVICHRLICPGTVDERVEEVVEGKRKIAELVLPKSSSLSDLDTEQLRVALGLRPDQMLAHETVAAEAALEAAQ